MARDYYADLGVARDASPEDIKSAFRRLARESHPDANPHDPAAESRFRHIAEAYEVLSNPERRRSYDRGETLEFSDLFAGFGGLDDLVRSVFGDGGFFSSQGGRPASNRGRDVLVGVEVDLATAAFGGETEVSFRTRLACDTCSGEGSAPGTSPITCPSCGGAGAVRVARRGLLGTMMTLSACTTCAGHGTIVSEPCPACRGAGSITGDSTVRVEIPAGVSDGTRLRLSARGEHPGRRGVAGDLHVEIRTRPVADFVREGDNLIHRLRLGMAEAALGVKVEIPLLEGGTEPLEIPPGTQPATVFRIPGLGTAHLGRRGRGDLLVLTEVQIPTGLSREEEEALRIFAQLRGEQPAAPTGKRRRNR
ncbi:MAG TPA: DnaJ C-terminal domain-containing protein [Acidimicrobiia bacterium]|nr:DnaJ C-terminal domain-containing protein [Acidimicrobiia bacterium]